jgi:REP element-mobilizing transposase RayT
MVHGYHVIFGAYGFWLPNDPRGSWSEFVSAWELVRFRRATKTDSRRSVAHKQHDYQKRLGAKQSLKYPPVCFTGVQPRAVARGFGESVTKSKLKIWACAILSDHVHLVVGRYRLPVERIAILLKGEATRQLDEEKMHPLRNFHRNDGRTPTPWSRGEWKVFLNSESDILRAIRYVENNPVKEHKPPQKWSFVTPFEGIV